MYLTPSARKQVDYLLGAKGTLSGISSWADRVRPQRRQTAPWHYINFPLEESEPDFNVYSARGGNIVSAIANNLALLQDLSGDRKRRVEALKFVVHLAGDLHQPMHCGSGEDRGGNLVAVLFEGLPTNLHAIWDSRVSPLRDQPPLRAAQELWNQSTPRGRAALARGTPYQWMLESHLLARDYVYPVYRKAAARSPGRPPELSGDYVWGAEPVAGRQIFKAGIRLGALLNQIWGGPQPTPAPSPSPSPSPTPSPSPAAP